jgi:hypothetical protein
MYEYEEMIGKERKIDAPEKKVVPDFSLVLIDTKCIFSPGALRRLSRVPIGRTLMRLDDAFV